MKSNMISAAYDASSPDPEAKRRMLAAIAQKEKKMKKRSVTRLLAAAAVCAALLATTGAAGYTIWHRWFLPEPKTYTPTENGAYEVHTSAEYTSGGANGSEAEPLSDGYFMELAEKILLTAGLEDADRSVMTVVRSTALRYGREEAEVLYSADKYHTSVRFNADTGALLGLGSIDWCEDPPEAPGAPEAAAERYYALLPVEQGYEITHVEKYDEQYWSYSFTKKTASGLYNPYQEVRISINPKTGRLTGCSVFCFPLLDDHLPGEEPLTEAQAVGIAAEIAGDTGVKVSAEIKIVLPNWMFTEHSGTNLGYSEVSRLAWVVRFDSDGGVIATSTIVYVDLYTGEVLGGDGTN